MRVPGQTPEEPFQPVGPIDEVKMTDTDKCALILAPATTLNAGKERSVTKTHREAVHDKTLPNQSIIWGVF